MLSIQRIQRPDSELVEALFYRAGMKLEFANPSFFSEEHNILLVAFSGAEPCGFLFAYCLESLGSKRPMMFLYSIDVFPPFRKQGVGYKLIEELKCIALKKQCSEIFVLTNDSNSVAKGLYQKTGGKRENLDDVMFIYQLQQSK